MNTPRTAPSDALPGHLYLAFLAMGALVAVYAFLSVAEACIGLDRHHRPPPAPTASELAHAARGEGRLREAVQLFEQAGEHAWVARLRFDLGLEARRAGRLAVAERELRAALHSNPEHIGAVAELLETLRRRGHLDTAAKFVATLSRKMALEPLVVFAKARLAESAGDPRAAVALLEGLERTGRLPLAGRKMLGRLQLRLVAPGAIDRF